MNLLEILGSVLVGFGIMGLVWFVRKLFRPKNKQPTSKTVGIRWIVSILSLICVPVGWYIYSGFGEAPLGGLALGLLLGIRVLINEHTGRWY